MRFRRSSDEEPRESRFPSIEDVRSAIPEGRKPYLAAERVVRKYGYEMGALTTGPTRGEPVMKVILDLVEADEVGTLVPPLSTELRGVFQQIKAGIIFERESASQETSSAQTERDLHKLFSDTGSQREVAMLALTAAVDHGRTIQ